MGASRECVRRGFTLIELLVVIGILGLLMSILLPTLQSSRNAAKRTETKVLVKSSIQNALTAFYNDIGQYPDSRRRTDPTEYNESGSSHSGGDPYGRTIDHPGDATTLYGAQALVQGLMGKDLKGYVDPKKARKHDGGEFAPTEWYDVPSQTPSENYISDYPRQELYFSQDAALVRTRDLPGIKPIVGGEVLGNQSQYVFVDSFGFPILYYKANPGGTVLCDGDRRSATIDDGSLPYYDQRDNDLFTGNEIRAMPQMTGWKFGIKYHQIAALGDLDEPDCVPGESGCDTIAMLNGLEITMPFSKYIHDHASEQASAGGLIPYNKDSYILISAGLDGSFGTSDDVKNFGRDDD